MAKYTECEEAAERVFEEGMQWRPTPDERAMLVRAFESFVAKGHDDAVLHAVTWAWDNIADPEVPFQRVEEVVERIVANKS